MPRLPRSLLLVSSCAAGALMASCLPSPMPAGYTYHREEYKSPPAPMAEGIGYDFTLEANKRAVDAWREIGQDLVSRLENTGALTGREIAVIPPLGVDQINNSLYYALNDALAARGYKLRSYSPDIAGLAVTIHPLIGKQKSEHEKLLAEYANAHGFKPEDVTGVSIRLQLREGAKAVQELEAAYSIPSFAYDPEFNRQLEFRDARSVGLAPYRAPEDLKPALIRPAAPQPMPETEEKAEEDPSSIRQDDLEAPQPRDDANKPLDLQEFNK